MNRIVQVCASATSDDFGTPSYAVWDDRAAKLEEYARSLGFRVDTEHTAPSDHQVDCPRSRGID